jgi:hypothetical protein
MLLPPILPSRANRLNRSLLAPEGGLEAFAAALVSGWPKRLEYKQ